MISSQFIQSCQSGDEEAIQSLVRTYQRAVYQLALSVIDDGQVDARTPDAVHLGTPTGQAEAATRETFIAALDRLGRYREGANFETWLYGLAIQISSKRARKWRARRCFAGLFWRTWRAVTRSQPAQPDPESEHFLGLQEQPDGTGLADRPERLPAHGAASAPLDADLWTSVRKLDEKLRVPVVLRYYHEYPINDIALLLHISEGTVHARLDLAREKIATRLETMK